MWWMVSDAGFYISVNYNPGRSEVCWKNVKMLHPEFCTDEMHGGLLPNPFSKWRSLQKAKTKNRLTDSQFKSILHSKEPTNATFCRQFILKEIYFNHLLFVYVKHGVCSISSILYTILLLCPVKLCILRLQCQDKVLYIYFSWQLKCLCCFTFKVVVICSTCQKWILRPTIEFDNKMKMQYLYD